MIVDPDFLDHWRTGMVVDALGDAMAPLYIMRLWAHCQERKSDTFAMPTRGLKAQCKFPGDAQAFEAALIEAGFIARVDDSVVVCGWAEKNASLLAAWANGNKGGRPKKAQKEPSENPRVTQEEPMANPDETHAEPIREEKRREEETPSLRSGAARATRKCPVLFLVTDELRAWAERETPGVDIERETAKFRDYTFKTAHSDWPGAWRNWMRRTFEKLPNLRAPKETDWQRGQRERMQQFAPGVAAKTPGYTPNNVIDLEMFDVPAIASR